MATLIVSSVVSWATGSQLLGAVAGTLVGMAMTPDMPDTQGSRVSDLTIQASTEGAPIPKIYGRSRIAGNIIWSSGINETIHSQEVGGKGGGGSTQTTYTYGASFAVGLCESEIVGIGKIWADGSSIYNNTSLSTDDEVAVSESLDITIYTGSETQLVDPLIEADQGVGNTSANRGLAYIVFDQFQLANYGNRIPNLTFEVVANGHFANEVTSSWFTANDDDPNFISTTVKLTTSYEEDINKVNHLEADNDGGTLWIYSWSSDLGGGNESTNIAESQVWADLREIVHHKSSNHKSLKWLRPTGSVVADGFRVTDNLGNWYSNNGILLDEFPARREACAYVIGDTMYMIIERHSATYGDQNIVLRSFDISSGTSFTPSYTTTIDVDIYSPAASVTYDAKNNLVYVEWSGTGIIGWLIEFDTSLSQQMIWDVGSVIPHPVEYPVTPVSLNIFIQDRTIYRHISDSHLTENSGFWIHSLDSDGSYEYVDKIICPTNVPGSSIVAISENKFTSMNAILKLNILNLETTYIADIIEDVCNDANTPSADIIVSSITDQIVGYTRTHPMTARTAIEPLLTAYHIYATEIDYLLKFYKKDGIVNETILEDQLAATISNVPDKITITRREDLQMPRRLEITYTDQDGDYQPGNQFAQRIIT